MTGISSTGGRWKQGRWAILGGGVILLLLLWPSLSRLFWQILFAAFLAAAALPLSHIIERKFPRSASAALSIGIFILGAIGFIGLFLPHLIAQFSLLIQQAPRLFSLLQEYWGRLARAEWFRQLGVSAESPEKFLQQAARHLTEILPLLLGKIGAGVDFISRAFLSPVLAYYFLRDRETFCYQLSLWIPARHRKRVLTALREMRREAGGYIRGQLLISLSVAVLTALGLLLAGIPAWLALGLLMGVCELIPYVGPLIGAVPIAIFALPMGMKHLLWGLGVAIFVQQIEGYFLSPRLMAGATGLHPVSVILLLSAGGLLWGLMGMVIALPAFVCFRGAMRVLFCSTPPSHL
ncbi:MAG: AI-2E family transporter [Clostridiales bacterium]|nr:AI-2E family transporter [Clostridiales bacterium]